MTPKITKITIFSCFQRFYAFFFQIFDFVDWNVEKDQHWKNVLSSRLFWRDNCIVFNENVSNWHRKRQKSKTFPIFPKILTIFSKFLTDFVNWNVKKG